MRQYSLPHKLHLSVRLASLQVLGAAAQGRVAGRARQTGTSIGEETDVTDDARRHVEAPFCSLRALHCGRKRKLHIDGMQFR